MARRGISLEEAPAAWYTPTGDPPRWYVAWLAERPLEAAIGHGGAFVPVRQAGGERLVREGKRVRDRATGSRLVLTPEGQVVLERSR